MGNAIRYLKMKIAKLPLNLTEAEAKAVLVGKINSFIEMKIEVADQVITSSGAGKINHGDVILTHAK
jgi:translation initiation factor eIF-2B subunit delta